ncbi:MAG: hypothetical protein P8M18_04090, partial [Woeseiaceae bacterium]|nr:hypothetical protein [Woeseiaceae bacterium]
KEELKKSLAIEEFQADNLMREKAIKVLRLLEAFRKKRNYAKEDLILLLKTQDLVKEAQQ